MLDGLQGYPAGSVIVHTHNPTQVERDHPSKLAERMPTCRLPRNPSAGSAANASPTPTIRTHWISTGKTGRSASSFTAATTAGRFTTASCCGRGWRGSPVCSPSAWHSRSAGALAGWALSVRSSSLAPPPSCWCAKQPGFQANLVSRWKRTTRPSMRTSANCRRMAGARLHRGLAGERPQPGPKGSRRRKRVRDHPSIQPNGANKLPPWRTTSSTSRWARPSPS